MSDEPGIPAQRLAPSRHLARAAKAPVDSDAERYHLGAASAEALCRMEATLALIEKHLALIAKVAVDNALDARTP